MGHLLHKEIVDVFRRHADATPIIGDDYARVATIATVLPEQWM